MRSRKQAEKFLQGGSKNLILGCFRPIDPTKPVSMKEGTSNEFYYEFVVENGVLEKEKSLETALGNAMLKIDPVPGTTSASLKIARSDSLPEKYSFEDIYQALKRNASSGLFVGVGPFGPEFVSYDSFVNAAVAGSSGFGKGSFFRFAIAQSILFRPNSINHIVDPKGLDFGVFKDAPGVGMVVKEAGDFIELLDLLLLEIKIRAELYNAWMIPPASLKEYNEMKTEEMPSLPYITVWIDEFSSINDMMFHTFEGRLNYIARTGRAFGINLIFACQAMNDISAYFQLIGKWFSFYENGRYRNLTEERLTDTEVTKPIPGRCLIATGLPNNWHLSKPKIAQAPLISNEELQGLIELAKRENRAPIPNLGFQRFTVGKNLVSSRHVWTVLGPGTLDDVMNPLREFNPSIRGLPEGGKLFSQVHDINNPKLKDEEAAKEIEEKRREGEDAASKFLASLREEEK